MDENQKLKTFEPRLQKALDYFNLSPIQEPNWRSLTVRVIFTYGNSEENLKKAWEQAVLAINDKSLWQPKKGEPDFEEALEKSSVYLWEELIKFKEHYH